jgi:hypothetical protein
MSEQTPAPAPDPSATPAKPAADPAAAPASTPATPAAPATVLGSDPAADPAKPTPATWPDDWRTRLAGGDDKALKRLERFADPGALAKSLMAAEARIRSGELKPTLAADAKPEEVAAWRAENGIPDKPEGYLEKLDLADAEKPLVSAFAEAMHKQNASPAVVKSAIEVYQQIQRQQAESRAEADVAAQQGVEDTLRQEWGGNYRGEVNAINGLLDQAPKGVKEAMLSARGPDGSLLLNNVDAVRWLSAMAREINPASTVVPGAGANAGKAIEERLGEIQKMMGDRKSAYWRGPESAKLQAEFRDLVSAQERMKSRAA